MNVFMVDLFQKASSALRLGHQDVERRNIGVPFNQRRYRAEACQRFRVECPHLGGDTRAMIVDSQCAPVIELPDGVTREMDLADSGPGSAARYAEASQP